MFTGGIGEHSASVREKTLALLGVLGFRIAPEANEQAVRGVSGTISAPGSTPALVVPTNEELMIAREAARVLEAR